MLVDAASWQILRSLRADPMPEPGQNPKAGS